MRQLVTIQKIKEILPIEGADFIELVKIQGWQCVAKKGDFKVGDLCCYYEIDSWLPIEEQYEFLRKSCYRKNELGEGFRIKTIRLKGQVSQGLVLPISTLQGKKFPDDKRENPVYDWKEGDIITPLVNVIKYDVPIPPQLQGIVKGNFPNDICPKTDETRIQILQHLLDKYKGTMCYVSEKMDGSSITFMFDGKEFRVCSRNLELKESPENALWKFAIENKIEEKLRKLSLLGISLSLQGEIIGEGIQGNPLKYKGQKILFFNAYNIIEQKYLGYEDFINIIKKLQLETVPILDTNHIMLDKVEDYVYMAIDKSVLYLGKEREGIVVRPIKEIIDANIPELERGRVSFKAINNEYLLKEA